VLLAEEAELGFEFGDAGVELCFALAGAVMHGPPVTGLLPEVEELPLARAGRTERRPGMESGVAGGRHRESRAPARQAGRVRREGHTVHGSSMSGAQLHNQVSSNGLTECLPLPRGRLVTPKGSSSGGINRR
jgi:hypothetical protein